MKARIILQLHTVSTATSDELSDLATQHASQICDKIKQDAADLAGRTLYSMLYSYLYNSLLLSHPNFNATHKALLLQEALGKILDVSGINIDALISFKNI